MRSDGEALEQAILALLARREVGTTICPSEVARAVGGEAWRDLMEDVRQAGRRLAARGAIAWWQRGSPVDPQTVRGAVRFAHGPDFSRGPHGAPEWERERLR